MKNLIIITIFALFSTQTISRERETGTLIINETYKTVEECQEKLEQVVFIFRTLHGENSEAAWVEVECRDTNLIGEITVK